MRLTGTSPSKKGGVNEQKVNDEGQALTRATTEDETIHQVRAGEAYTVYTGRFNVVDALFHPFLYIKNNDDEDLIFTTIITGAAPSTSGANNAVLVENIGNILTTDDLVANGADLPVINRNLGSSRPFDGVVKFKADAVASGNEVRANGVLSDFDDATSIPLTVVVPKGGTVALGLTCPAGNTSQDITVTLSFHLDEQL